MNGFYIYKDDFGPYSNVLVCYVSNLGFDFIKFSEIIKMAFDGSIFSKHVVVISAYYNREQILNELIENKAVIDALKKRVNNYQSIDFHLISMEGDGAFRFDDAADLSDASFRLADLANEIMDRGLVDISVRHNLVMESTPNYHFVKPSGKHANRFIKASNVLQRSAEISFLALNVIRKSSIKISRIYTDTVGIFPLAYEVANIARNFKEDNLCEFIDSFGSYQGLDSYEFSGDESTIVLISASTSDELARKLKQKVGLSKATIISVFSSGDSEDFPVLVSFPSLYKKYGIDIFSPIISNAGHECDLCIYERSIPLALSNSHFVFEPLKAELYLPISRDSDQALRKLISKYKNSGAFKCLYDGLGGDTHPVPEYFIDVSRLVNEDAGFDEKIANFVKRSYPLYADYIVHASDQGALDLATKISMKVKELGKSVQLKSIFDIDDATISGGVVVVAGSIQSGKSLLDISRKLRHYKDLPITYVVGFAKFNDPASFSKLKRDLTFNNGSKELGNHSFIAIEEIILPIYEHRSHSWERETDLIKAVKSMTINTSESLEKLEARDKFLRTAADSSMEGVGDHIFHFSPSNEKMVLGPTFAFWAEMDAQAQFEHQATVYYTISSILQSLRYLKPSRDDIPLGAGYIVRQLDPLIFDRFNEGVIQASILRAAKPRELDYSADDTSSKIVGSLVVRMMKNPLDRSSEALPEFIIALCTGKLQIKKDHLCEMFDTIFDKNKFPLMWILLEYAKTKLSGKENDIGASF